MLTKEHKRMLAVLVGEQRHVLMAKTGPNVTQRMKAEIWSQIVQQLRSSGASIEETRNVREVEWNNIKRRATKRQELGRPLDDLDLLVLDALGKSDNSNTSNNESSGSDTNVESNGLLAGHHAIFSSNSGLESVPLSVEISESNGLAKSPKTSPKKRVREEQEDEDADSLRPLKRSLLVLELEMARERQLMEREKHAMEVERLRVEMDAQRELHQLHKQQLALKIDLMRKAIKNNREQQD